MAAPHPNQVAFREGVQYLFHSWTALKLAVDGEWGGHDSAAKRDWFVDTIVDYFGERKTFSSSVFIVPLLHLFLCQESSDE